MSTYIEKVTRGSVSIMALCNTGAASSWMILHVANNATWNFGAVKSRLFFLRKF